VIGTENWGAGGQKDNDNAGCLFFLFFVFGIVLISPSNKQIYLKKKNQKKN